MRLKTRDERLERCRMLLRGAKNGTHKIQRERYDRPTKKLPQVLIDRRTRRAERRSDITTVIETLSDAHAAPPIIE